MVKIKDSVVVRALGTIYNQINERKPAEDHKREINSEYTAFVDCGERGKSIILQEVLEQVASADQSIQLIFQLLPSGKVLDVILEKAKSGVEIDVITQAREHLEGNSIPLEFLQSVPAVHL